MMDVVELPLTALHVFLLYGPFIKLQVKTYSMLLQLYGLCHLFIFVRFEVHMSLGWFDATEPFRTTCNAKNKACG